MFGFTEVFGIVLKSSLLLAVALAITSIQKRRSAATLHRIWILAFLGCLVVPAISLSPLAWHVEVPANLVARVRSNSSVFGRDSELHRGPVVASGGYSQTRLPSPGLPQRDSQQSPPVDDLHGERAAKATDLVASIVGQEPASSFRSPNALWAKLESSWFAVVLLSWCIGTITCLARTAWRQFTLQRLLVDCTVLTGSEWRRVVDECRRSLGISQHVRLELCPRIETAIVYGTFRPIVALPSSAAGWSSRQRRLVLLHELAHVRRRDLLTQQLAGVVCAIHWFNALSWIGLRQMRQLRERACDDLVLQCNERPSDYAELLLDVARSYRGQPIGTAIGMVHKSGVEGRIQSILDNARSRVALTWKRALLLFATASVLVAMIGSMQLRTLRAQEKARPQQTDNGQTSKKESSPHNALRDMEIAVFDESGKPLEGARVHISIWYTEQFTGKQLGNRDRFTDSYGRLAVSIPRRLRIFRLWASKASYVTEFVNFAQGTHDEGLKIPDRFEFRLATGTEIGGRVVNQRGMPIAGVKVDVAVEVDEPNWSTPNTMISTWLTDEDYNDGSAVTNDEGLWRITNAPAPIKEGDYEFRLKFTHDSYSSDANYGGLQKEQNITTPLLRNKSAKVVMQDGVQVIGKVIAETGAPVSEGLVIWHRDPYHGPGVHETRTEETGVFTTLPLSPGEYPFTIVAAGYSPEMQTIVVSESMEMPTFKLKPGKRLQINIVDRSGAPVPNAWVGLRGWRNAESLYNHDHPNVPDSGIPRRSDSDGVYVWDWAPEDAVKYAVSAKNFSYTEVTLTAIDEPHVVQLASELVAVGSVTDAKTGQPIKSFSAIPVVEFRPNFLSTTFRGTVPGADGRYELPFDDHGQGYRHRIRIEAPGYRSVLSEHSYSVADGRIQADFAIEPAPVRSGRVVDRNGNPVEGAVVVEATPSVVPSMRAGELEWEGRQVTTSKDGRYELHASSEPVLIRAAHEAGFGEVVRQPDDALGDIQLRAWVSMAGQLTQQGKPLAEQTIHFAPLIDRQLGEPRFQDSYWAKTDDAGRFRFDRLPPIVGSVRAYRGPWQDSVMTSSLSVPVDLQPGESREIQLEPPGTVVSGRVVTPSRDDNTLKKNWSLNYLISRDRGVSLPTDTTLSFEPKGAVEASWFLHRDSQIWLRCRENHFVKLAADGQFTIHGVAPGTYDLVFRLYEQPAGCLVETIGERVVTVEVTGQDIAQRKKDVGNIEVVCRTGPRVGEDMRIYEFTDTTGRARSIGEMKGRVVLMHVWASWCEPCMEHMPEIQQHVRATADKPVTYVGLNIDGDIDHAKSLSQRNGWTWSQNYLGDNSDMASQLAVFSVPTYFLIGPDGVLLAATNDWNATKERLAELLDE